MKANMGSSDRIIRFFLALLIGVLYFTNVITGVVGTILLIVGAVFLLTSLIGYCPAYFPFGINTKGRKK